MHNLLDPSYLLSTFGYIGLGAIIFAETGLLVGFFLPGDSLLITAGILTSQGNLNIVAVIVLVFSAAVIGDAVGYYFGKRVGPALFEREDSRFFKKERLLEAHRFFEKYGPQSVVLARFLPIIRTFTPVIAGTSEMPYKKFLAFNILGAALWVVGITMLGYKLGQSVANIDKYLIPLLGSAIIIPILPGLWHLYRSQKGRKGDQ